MAMALAAIVVKAIAVLKGEMTLMEVTVVKAIAVLKEEMALKVAIVPKVVT
ncbi:hypothetical protein J0811_02315 [Bacillus paranthracis]|nr:hypothetical protein [Bacillus cereus]HDR7257930.1 hypothetical protein [Bacillus paranthracis]